MSPASYSYVLLAFFACSFMSSGSDTASMNKFSVTPVLKMRDSVTDFGNSSYNFNFFKYDYIWKLTKLVDTKSISSTTQMLKIFLLIFSFQWAAEFVAENAHCSCTSCLLITGVAQSNWKTVSGGETFGSFDTWEGLDSSGSMWKKTKRQRSSNLHRPGRRQRKYTVSVSHKSIVWLHFPSLPPSPLNTNYSIPSFRLLSQHPYLLSSASNTECAA